MALKGKPRDMNKWREVLLDPNVHFPGEFERIPAHTQRAVGGGGRAPAAERAGRRPPRRVEQQHSLRSPCS